MLLLNRSEVESLLDLDRLIDALGPAMAELSAGRVSMPARIVSLVDRSRAGLLAAMPVYLGVNAHAFATKLVSVFPENEAQGMPSHQAVILVFDAETGSARALMDGTFITAARTAAGSALVRSASGPRRLARPADHWNRRAGARPRLGDSAGAADPGNSCRRAATRRRPRVSRRKSPGSRASSRWLVRLGKQAFAGADVICAATHAAEPVVKGAWLEPGTHVTSVGLNAGGCEVDAEAVLKSLVVVETREAALAPNAGGANDLKWPIRDGLMTVVHLHAEIGELISGAKSGRTSAEQITLYKSVGVAVQDAVAAHLVLAAAEEKGMGREFEI